MKRDYKLFMKDIINAIDAVERFVEGLEFDELVKDDLRMSAVLWQLAIIGEAVKNIPEWIREKYPQIPWRSMAGMRDRLIHGYFGISYKVVWSTIKIEIPKVKSEFQKILVDLEKNSKSEEKMKNNANNLEVRKNESSKSYSSDSNISPLSR